MNRPDADEAQRVLVVDDNQSIHEDFRKIFEATGARPRLSEAELALFGGEPAPLDVPHFQIDSAYQGEEGMAMVQRALEQGRPYAMAFVDVRMPPGWDGIDTTAHIWECDPDIQVVICTAYTDYTWTEMLVKLGRSDRMVILKKPFDTIEVLQLATALTEKWRLARQLRATLEGLERNVADRTHELVLAGQRLEASEAQYRLLFDRNPLAMWVHDLQTLRFLMVNGAAVEHYGYSRQQFLAMTIPELSVECGTATLEPFAGENNGLGEAFGASRHRMQDGSVIDVETTSNRITFDGRNACLTLALDVTERKLAESTERRLNRVYAVLSQINALIVRVNNSEELYAGACRIAVEAGGFRMALLGIVDRSTGRLVPVASAGVDDALLAAVKQKMAHGEFLQGSLIGQVLREKKLMTSDDLENDSSLLLGEQFGEYGIKSMALMPLVVADVAVGAMGLYSGETGFFHAGEVKLLTELSGDVAFAIDHLNKQERLNYLAYYDALTGLANRSLFIERVAQHMRSAASGGHQLALCVMDLERFRYINDSLGRASGDMLLRLVADWLTAKLGDASLMARVGADQFALVVPEIGKGEAALQRVAHMIESFMSHPFSLNDGVFRIAAKAGVSLYPDDGGTVDALYKNAESALKNAKGSGDRCRAYTQQMSDAVAGRLTLENRLRDALGRGEFVLHYQPKVSLASGKVCGAEALIRWNDPQSGLVPPNRFIPILEETGLIHEVGRWAMRQAIADHRRWLDAGLASVRIAVNVSSVQLRNRGFIAQMEQDIGTDARAGAGVELEITESLIMEDVRHSITSLHAIRALGVSIAIDDFGTGFSSLGYLSKLPLDTLKIDRSFIVEMTVGPQGLALVSTIIHLAHALKLKVVAEGIETEEQSRLLRLLGCDEVQGFLISKAVPREKFEATFLLPLAPALQTALVVGAPLA